MSADYPTRDLAWSLKKRATMKSFSLLFALFAAASAACGSTIITNDPTPGPAGPPVSTTTSLKEVDRPDVTIVFPLPTRAADVESLLSGTAKAAHGELIPKAAFDQLDKPLDARSPGAAGKMMDGSRSGLRLVAVRLDPCFGDRGSTNDAECKNQMRLVFQGIDDREGTIGAADGAVHVFVELARDEFIKTVKRVLALKEASGAYAAAPLAVHPLMAKEGLAGSFAKGINSIVLEHAGDTRTTRMTFFVRTAARQPQWFFGIFEKKGPAFERASIATIDGQEQNLVGGLGGPSGLSGSTSTPTNSEDNLLLLLNTSQAESKSPAERKHAYDSLLRIENPTKHTPDTIDCVSCHVATPVRRVSETKFNLSATENANAFASTLPTTFEAPAVANLENIHALSYLGTELGINQRTANESAAVATAINKLLAAQ